MVARIPLPSPLPVALCVGQYLPASETFIYDQLRHQVRTRAFVLARDHTAYAPSFPYEDVQVMGRLEQIAYYHLGLSKTVRRALAARQPKVIHAHFGLNGTMILKAARRENIPLVVSFHGHDVGGLEPQNRRSWRYGRYQRLSAEMFAYATSLLCASTDLAERLVERGAPEKKVLVHHLGVDTRVFFPLEDRFDGKSNESQEPRILMVGRLVEKKGHTDALQAFAHISKEFPRARLRLVGDGPLGPSLVGKAQELGIASRVDFLGAFAPSEVLAEMRAATVLLTPSFTTLKGDRESGVIVLKEAAAVGLPVVATRHGGIPEIVQEGETGYLVNERDVSAMSARLAQLLRSSDLCRQMGERALRTVRERYDSRAQNARLEEILLRAAAR